MLINAAVKVKEHKLDFHLLKFKREKTMSELKYFTGYFAKFSYSSSVQSTIN